MGIFTISEPPAAVTAAMDVLAVVSGATRSTRLRKFHVFQTTDVGDAQEEIIYFRVRSGQSTVGSGGGSSTAIVAADQGLSAATFTARTRDTAIASSGTIVIHDIFGWNIRQPWDFIFPDDCRFKFDGARRWTIELVSTPADSLSIGFSATIEEL